MLLSALFALFSNVLLFTGYIDRQNSFAMPLDEKTEKELLERMWAGDNRAKEELVKHNMRLIAHVAKKYAGCNDNDELISVGSIGLVKAVNTYSKGKGTRFATYASKCIENEILMMLRSTKKLKANRSLYEPVSFDKDGNEVLLIDLLSLDEESLVGKVEADIIKEKLQNIVKDQLDEREYQIICLRYGLNDVEQLTQREIAKKFNISRSYVSRIETKALKKLRNYMYSNKISFS
ncbi:MAG: RNA polymerase sporulation sigma factor SigK [Eubacteriales bacterium]|nr:RNA polymerase sporulation sigma factor SigK [Eubacteriales bacterium]